MNFKDTMSRIYPTIYIDDTLKLTILKKDDLRESLRVRNIKEIRKMFFIRSDKIRKECIMV